MWKNILRPRKKKFVLSSKPNHMSAYKKLTDLKDALEKLYKDFVSSEAGYRADKDNTENFMPVISSKLKIRQALMILGSNVAERERELATVKSTAGGAKEFTKGVNPFRQGEADSKTLTKSANNRLRATVTKEKADKTDEKGGAGAPPKAGTKTAATAKPKTEKELQALKKVVGDVLNDLGSYTDAAIEEFKPEVLKALAKNLKIEGYKEMSDPDLVKAVASAALAIRNKTDEKGGAGAGDAK